MKKVMYLLALLISLSATAAIPPKINEKVIKAFSETFTEAENVSWKEMDDSYHAIFTMSQIAVKAIYDNEGGLLQTIKYYEGKNLPSNILAKLKSKQSDKTIFGVTEIITDTEVAFHIVLKDEKNWYWFKSDPLGNMELTQKLKRGEPREPAAF
jgi:hypothetical protein